MDHRCLADFKYSSIVYFCSIYLFRYKNTGSEKLLRINIFGCEILLEIEINNNLNFKEPIESLSKKATQEINTLFKLAPSMNLGQRRLMKKFFVIYHFSYYSVVPMF